MILLSKKAQISISILYQSQRGQERMTVDIDNSEIIFRARSCRTEVNIGFAKREPQRMNNAIKALVPDIFNHESEAIIREIIPILAGM